MLDDLGLRSLEELPQLEQAESEQAPFTFAPSPLHPQGVSPPGLAASCSIRRDGRGLRRGLHF